MKTMKKEIVTGYITDFGTRFSDEDLCVKCENQEYQEVFTSLYNIANDEQKVLLNVMIKELDEHFRRNYHREPGVETCGLIHLIESLEDVIHYGKPL